MHQTLAFLQDLDPRELQAQLSRREDLRIVRRIDAFEHLTPPPLSHDIGEIAIVDTETTGTDAATAGLVELGLLKAQYCRDSGRVLGITGQLSQLHDPGIPIPEEASAVHGITDDMVKGHALDAGPIEAALQGVDLVIAHNSSFDRVLLERYAPVFSTVPWGCSLRDVDWNTLGFSSGKLEYLAYRAGFFYGGHRAAADCHALLQILDLPAGLPPDPQTPLALLLQAARQDFVQLYAFNSPFDRKDILRARGYRWHAGDATVEKAWLIELRGTEALDTELAWLKAEVYAGRPCSPGVVKIDALSRFSGRLPELKRLYL